jgi:hypothetical protein
VFVQKKSKKKKKARRANVGLVSDQKISTGRIGGERNKILGNVAESRLTKMGGEILTAKPGVKGFGGTKVGRGGIENNEKLIEKHLNESKRVIIFQNVGIDIANDENLEIVKEEPISQLHKNRTRAPCDDIS